MICPACDTPHQRHGIYCSKQCKKRAENARRRGTDPRRALAFYDCAYCGKRCVPGKNVAYHASRFCGQPCKRAWHHVHVEGKAWRPVTRRQHAEVKLAEAAAGTTGRRWTMGWCTECGRAFVSMREATHHCSRDCKERAAKRRHVAAGRALARAIKSERGCTDCGAHPDPEKLHFHHLDPEEKEAGVSDLYSQHARLKVEIAKCIVLCQPCHQARHPQGERGGGHPQGDFPRDRMRAGPRGAYEIDN